MAVPGPASPLRRRGGFAAQFAVRAAVAAPSVHNTQPWFFVPCHGALELHADPARQLRCADPGGREMLISCGAALFNMRLAMRNLGFAADVRMFPDVSSPGLVAEVRWGRYVKPTRHEELLFRSVMRRHSHRGPFTAEPPPLAVADLVPAARREHADLRVIYDLRQQEPLAELVAAAECVQRRDRGFVAETARWTRLPGRSGRDGVPVSACPKQPDGLLFATRGFNDGTRWGFPVLSPPDNPHALGVVALLCTHEDRRADWVLAGQALQRVLLEATAAGIRVAFHTQPLELPGTRDQIRTDFADGACPQMLLRLGRGGHTVTTPRRAVTSVLRRALGSVTRPLGTGILAAVTTWSLGHAGHWPCP